MTDKTNHESSKIKVRELKEQETDLQSLIDKNQGLLIPLHELSEENKKALQDFLKKTQIQPVVAIFFFAPPNKKE